MFSRSFWIGSLVALPALVAVGLVLFPTPASREKAKPGSAAYLKAEKLTALLNEGQQQFREGNFVSAEQSYKAAIGLYPKMLPAWSQLGLVYAEMNRPDDAIKAFEQVYYHRDRAVGTQVTQPVPNYVYAQLCHAKGLYEKEQEAYTRILSQRRILKASPMQRSAKGEYDNDAMALVHLMVGDDYRDTKLAPVHYRKAAALLPTSGELLWELSWRGMGDKKIHLQVLQRLAASKENSDYPRQAAEQLFSYGKGPRPASLPEKNSKGVVLPMTPEQEKRAKERVKILEDISRGNTRYVPYKAKGDQKPSP